MKITIVKLVLCSILAFAFAGHHQAYAAKQTEERPGATVPMVSNVIQISPNQLQVTYDQPVDPSKGTDPKNYWIQSTNERKPTNIATLGMNDSVNKKNSLTSEKVAIQATETNGQSFVLTFKQNITKGMAFKIIICYLTKPGAPPYSGDNGSAVFVGQ